MHKFQNTNKNILQKFLKILRHKIQKRKEEKVNFSYSINSSKQNRQIKESSRKILPILSQLQIQRKKKKKKREKNSIPDR